MSSKIFLKDGTDTNTSFLRGITTSDSGRVIGLTSEVFYALLDRIEELEKENKQLHFAYNHASFD